MSNEERIDLLLVDHLPSDDEFDSIADADESTEVSPGSKENDPKAAKSPSASQPKKRRRILTLDSDDDSGDDATFKPSKAVSFMIYHMWRELLFWSCNPSIYLVTCKKS